MWWRSKGPQGMGAEEAEAGELQQPQSSTSTRSISKILATSKDRYIVGHRRAVQSATWEVAVPFHFLPPDSAFSVIVAHSLASFILLGFSDRRPLEERARLLGGSFRLESKPKKSATVSVEVASR